jgi:hypothetical protein
VTWRDVTSSICEASVTPLVDALTGYLTGQKVDGGSVLTIGTSDAFTEEDVSLEALPRAERKPCKLKFKIDGGQMKLWQMGEEASDRRCSVRAGLKIGLDIDFAQAAFYTEERLGDAN